MSIKELKNHILASPTLNWKITRPIYIYIFSYAPIIYIALSRTTPHFTFYENESFNNILILTICITAICLQYIYIASSNLLKELPIQKTFIVIFPLFLILTFTLPLFSRDYLAYLIPARNLVEFNANPYTIPIDSNINSWSQYVAGVWKSGPTNYPPIFIGIMSIIYYVNSYTSNLYLHTVSYKLIVLSFFFLSAFLLKKILTKSQNHENTNFGTNLFILNPLLITSYILDGHNDIFLIALILLLLLTLYDSKNLKSSLIWGIGTLVKYFTIILFPLLWFKNNKFNLRFFLYSIIFLLTTIYIITNLSSGLTTRILSGKKVDYFNACLYGCSIVTRTINQVSPTSNISLLIRLTIFLSGSLYLVIRIAKRSYIRYAFWIYILLFFVLLSWQTPWAYTYPLVIGLILSSEKTYMSLILLITCYAFLRYIGL